MALFTHLPSIGACFNTYTAAWIKANNKNGHNAKEANAHKAFQQQEKLGSISLSNRVSLAGPSALLPQLSDIDTVCKACLHVVSFPTSFQPQYRFCLNMQYSYTTKDSHV